MEMRGRLCGWVQMDGPVAGKLLNISFPQYASRWVWTVVGLGGGRGAGEISGGLRG